MKRQRQTRTSWLGRLIRGRRPDRNPLRRASDRAETAILAILMATFLAGAPFVALVASDRAYAWALHIEQAQQATFRQVPAVLLKVPAAGDWLTSDGLANARWTAPDGRPCTGQVQAPAGSAAGSTVLVWTTPDGTITSQPMQRAQVSNTAVLTAIAAVGGLAVALAFLGWAIRWALDRRRLAGWDADWLANGPRWTTRR